MINLKVEKLTDFEKKTIKHLILFEISELENAKRNGTDKPFTNAMLDSNLENLMNIAKKLNL